MHVASRVTSNAVSPFACPQFFSFDAKHMLTMDLKIIAEMAATSSHF